MNYLEKTDAGKQWKKIGIRHHHGINIPLFSIKSQNSSGIGEYLDLLPLIKWVSELKMDILQLLPLNDTGPETSPYSALSAYALNPIHLSLSKLLFVEESDELKSIIDDLYKLNNSSRINYKEVFLKKNLFLDKYVDLFRNRIIETEDYHHFMQANDHWIKDYALFKTLKIHTNWASWKSWTLTKEDEKKLLKFSQKHYIVQFLCFSQMSQVKKYAEKHHVFLKGDIPILINFESSDVWTHRELFNLNVSAGAPPDPLGPEGQNWDFPTYNWNVLKASNYNWWENRLKFAQNFYHLYRLDHVVGFFRIWTIPRGSLAKEGTFIPNNPNKWIPQGKEIMDFMIKKTEMLPIGEDLGTVPVEVKICLQNLGICGTKIIRWERKWDQKDQPYIPYSSYPLESMTSVSTHDIDSLQLWWQNSKEEAKAFSQFKNWSYEPILSLERLQEILYDSHHTTSLFHINLLNEYLTLVPELAHENPENDRINVPGLVSDYNWTSRYKCTVEEIIHNEKLKEKIKKIIE